MLKIVQEKFQVDFPDVSEEHGWQTDMESRVKKDIPGREGRAGDDCLSRYGTNTLFVNSLPPGMDIEDQEFSDIRQMGTCISGNLCEGYAYGDFTNKEVNAVSLRTGFDKKAELKTDDDYRLVDDVGGFVQRNNFTERM